MSEKLKFDANDLFGDVQIKSQIVSLFIWFDWFKWKLRVNIWQTNKWSYCVSIFTSYAFVRLVTFSFHFDSCQDKITAYSVHNTQQNTIYNKHAYSRNDGRTSRSVHCILLQRCVFIYMLMPSQCRPYKQRHLYTKQEKQRRTTQRIKHFEHQFQTDS